MACSLAPKEGDQEGETGRRGQVQWTYGPFIEMKDVDQAYLGFIEGLFEELRRRGMTLLATGHQPVSTAADIEVVPTEENNCLMAYADGNDALKDALLCSAKMSISMQYAHVDNFEKRLPGCRQHPAGAGQLSLITPPGLAARKTTLFSTTSTTSSRQSLPSIIWKMP